MKIDDGPIRELRRLVYCGEWIESHSLHIYLLHAPDFLGYPSFLELARDQPRIAEQGLAMKKAGNALVTAIGGREVHPINLCVGGFYKAPSRRELSALSPALERARDTALQTVRWASELPFPELRAGPELLALLDPEQEYPIDRGRLVSDRGLDIAPPQFDQHIVEEHVEHSHALHARIRERGSYLTGPMARYSLAFGCLGDTARTAAREAGLGSTCTNPFQSIIVRAVELVQACEDALSILSGYEPPDPPAATVVPRPGIGHGATEAPRGMLYHRYELDEQGTIVSARIVPPTSQNQAVIEDQLRSLVQQNIELAEEELRPLCEQAIRNHDPCISCATHFLNLTMARCRT
jgi:coenzyme F420-reducing hydrogenase alpha subunit